MLKVLIPSAQSGSLNATISSSIGFRVGLVRLSLMPVVPHFAPTELPGFIKKVSVSPLLPVMEMVSSVSPTL